MTLKYRFGSDTNAQLFLDAVTDIYEVDVYRNGDFVSVAAEEYDMTYIDELASQLGGVSDG